MTIELAHLYKGNRWIVNTIQDWMKWNEIESINGHRIHFWIESRIELEWNWILKLMYAVWREWKFHNYIQSRYVSWKECSNVSHFAYFYYDANEQNQRKIEQRWKKICLHNEILLVNRIIWIQRIQSTYASYIELIYYVNSLQCFHRLRNVK